MKESGSILHIPRREIATETPEPKGDNQIIATHTEKAEGQTATRSEADVLPENTTELAKIEDPAAIIGGSIRWQIEYDAYGEFDVERCEVDFIGPHELRDVSTGQVLWFRKEGETLEPEDSESEEHDAADDTLKMSELVAAEESEPGGVEALLAGEKEFQKLPVVTQQTIAMKYRRMADRMKAGLAKIIEENGDGYVIQAADIHMITSAIKAEDEAEKNTPVDSLTF